MQAHADRRGFLAGIEMDKAGDAAFRELFLHPLFEAADRDHRTIGADQLVAAQLHGIPPTPVARRPGSRLDRRLQERRRPGYRGSQRSERWPGWARIAD